MQNRKNIRTISGLIAGAAVMCTALWGCNIIGPIGVLLSPPPTVAKAYELPQKSVGIVFVDDRDNKLPRRTLRQTIGAEATARLMLAKTMANMIDTKAALNVVSREKPNEPMNVSAIGRECKADVVIWVAVDSFSLSPDGQTFSPGATLRVKVIDAVNDKKLWPEDEKAGYKLIVAPSAKAAPVPKNMGDVMKAEQTLAEMTGAAIAELFYDEKVLDSARIQKGSQ